MKIFQVKKVGGCMYLVKMPWNINDVQEPSTLNDFTGALILPLRESIAAKLFMQSSVLVCPAVKKLSR